MGTYRSLLRAPEFTAMFAAACLQSAGQTVAGLALATAVYARTGSPLAAALAMFGPSIAYLAGATLLMSAADRLPPRAAAATAGLLTAALTAVLAIPGLPVPAVFGVLLVMGLLGSVGGGVRAGLLTDLVPGGAYLLGRSLLNISNGAMQICGFAAGGLLLAALSPRGVLLTGAGLSLAAAAVIRFGLRRHDPRAAGRPSIAATWRGNARLWSVRRLRPVYAGLCIPNGLIVGCEALFIPYAPKSAGLLLACSAVGMLTGDVVAGRYLTANWRTRLAPLLRFLLAGPYLIFGFHPPLILAAAAVAAASIGYASTLLLQERLLELTPADLRGQALGLHTSAMLTMQAAGATVAGLVAGRTSPAAAITVMAAASVAVTLVLVPRLREPVPAPV